MPDISAITKAAWQASKTEQQDNYDDLMEDYRGQLEARAEGVISSGQAAEGSAFDHAVLDATEPSPEVKEELVAEAVAEVIDEPKKPTKQVIKKAAKKPAKKPTKAPAKKPTKTAVKAVKASKKK